MCVWGVGVAWTDNETVCLSNERRGVYYDIIYVVFQDLLAAYALLHSYYLRMWDGMGRLTCCVECMAWHGRSIILVSNCSGRMFFGY